MTDDRLLQELRVRLEKEGYRCRTVPVRCLRDLQEAVEGIRVLLDEEFYQERLTHFSFQVPEMVPNAKSLVVVAAPQPQIRVVFNWKGEPRPVIVPPTYARMTDKIVESILSSVIGPEGHHFARAAVPLKLLAVRSGLGEYGRNNICYVSGFGSFNRLAAYYTSVPCSGESWREPQMMHSCQNCQACSRACRTGAITAERFLIRAERCITFHNERANEFPDWMNPVWHNCLIGCMHCQLACPENASVRRWVEDDQVFSEEETGYVLNSSPPARLPQETMKKLEKLGLLEDAQLLGRNLNVFLKR